MDLCDLGVIKQLMCSHGFSFSKSMGQNFLIADWVPKRIAGESGIGQGNGVLEIGPGIGCLTQALSPVAGRVVSVELDKRLLPILSETVGTLPNVDIVSGDIMSVDLAGLVGKYFSGLEPVVCANLPYNITTPVLTKLINSKSFSSITVMVQKEVARRICASPGSKEYGAFSIYSSFYTDPKLLFDVPPSCFEPRPKVTSSVISLTLKETNNAGVNEKLFFQIVRAAFNQRRKTILNSLSSAFSKSLSKGDIAGVLMQSGINQSARGEELDIEDFKKVTGNFQLLIASKKKF